MQSAQIKSIGTFNIFLDRRLGGGNYGEIYEAEFQATKAPAACKVINLHRTEEILITREKDILFNMSLLSKTNENLVQLYEYVLTTNNLYLFCLHCNGGNLRMQMLSKQTEVKMADQFPSGFYPKEVKTIMMDLINGYKTLFQNNIMHRDIKPENILIHNGVYKIADFGFARYDVNVSLNEEKTLKRCTPIYGAPQLFGLDGPHISYTNLCDMWSLGIIFHELVFGEKPYSKDTTNYSKLIGELLQIKVIGGVKKPKNTYFTQELEEFWGIIEKMIKYQEIERLKWEDLFLNPVFKKQGNIKIKILQQY